MSESKIQTNIIQCLKNNGAIVIRNVVATNRGIPDLTVIYKGITFFIEVKTEKGVLSFHQVDFIYLLKYQGVCTLVADNVKDVEFVIDRLKKGEPLHSLVYSGLVTDEDSFKNLLNYRKVKGFTKDEILKEFE